MYSSYNAKFDINALLNKKYANMMTVASDYVRKVTKDINSLDYETYKRIVKDIPYVSTINTDDLYAIIDRVPCIRWEYNELEEYIEEQCMIVKNILKNDYDDAITILQCKLNEFIYKNYLCKNSTSRHKIDEKKKVKCSKIIK